MATFDFHARLTKQNFSSETTETSQSCNKKNYHSRCFQQNKRANTILAVTSIVVEQDSFQTEHRIAGNSNKLVYFRKLTLQVYSTKLLYIRINQSLLDETLILIYMILRVLETSIKS